MLTVPWLSPPLLQLPLRPCSAASQLHELQTGPLTLEPVSLCVWGITPALTSFGELCSTQPGTLQEPLNATCQPCVGFLLQCLWLLLLSRPLTPGGCGGMGVCGRGQSP